MGDGGDQVGALAVEPGPGAARAQAHRHAGDRAAAGVARWIRAATSTSSPVGSTHDCSGTPVRVTSPSYGLVAGDPAGALLVGDRQHLAQRPPHGGVAVGAEHRRGAVVEER